MEKYAVQFWDFALPNSSNSNGSKMSFFMIGCNLRANTSKKAVRLGDGENKSRASSINLMLSVKQNDLRKYLLMLQGFQKLQ